MEEGKKQSLSCRCHAPSAIPATWCVPFIPAYRNRVHLTLPLLLFPILFNSVQKHLVICARLSLIGHSRFTGKGIRKEYSFFFLKGVNKYLSNIFYTPGTMKVSVEPPMNKIGLVPDLISLKMLW